MTMMTITMVLVLVATLLLPALVLKVEKKLKIIQWLGPVVSCYILGIILGNTLGEWWNGELARTVSELSVLLALPMLLFSTDLGAWLKLAKKTIFSFVLVVVSVSVMALLVGYLFSDKDPEVWKMAGMMVGVYTGGTPNLMAIGKALGIREDAFIMLNASDMVLGGVYLLFIMSVGVKILTRLLPAFDHSIDNKEDELDLWRWSKLGVGHQIKHVLILLVLSGGCVGIAVGVSRLITGRDEVSIIVLALTVLAVLLSFSKKVRYFEGSQESGQYLLLSFCVAIGSLANASELFTGSWWYFIFVFLIMIGSIILHFSACFFFKIDRDTAIITSMAGVFGPAFVAPMCQVLKNRSILFSGVTTGLVGYAVGNIVGLMVAYILKGI
jgi:uncharacterized membrane protein